MKKIVYIRRISQVFFFVLFIYILWSTTYPLKGLLPARSFFIFNPLLMIFMSISSRIVLPGIWAGVAMLGLTLIGGRFFCGWVCPLGTLIDCAGHLRIKRGRGSYAQQRPVRFVKFIIFTVGAVAAVVGVHIFWIFDPMVIMGRFVSLNLIPFITSTVNGLFITLIQRFQLYGAFYDIYRSLKQTVLGIEVHYFANSLAIFVFMIVVLSLTLIQRRLWCRMICPLGAFYALVARVGLMRRVVSRSCVHCHNCEDICRMAAIYDDVNYDAGECIMCMDCIAVCPSHETTFKWVFPKSLAETRNDKGSVSRRSFLALLGVSIVTLISAVIVGRGRGAVKRRVIRPPAALPEKEFLNRCVRCGNCMKVCVTNGLQPTFLEAGLDGIWTPQLVPEIGYCEYNCTLCGEVCPTQAIPALPLEKKQKARLGLASVNKELCIAWALNQECLVCEEHCPIPNKAIKTERTFVNRKEILKPVVDPSLCIGCGACQHSCPVRPVRAITVMP